MTAPPRLLDAGEAALVVDFGSMIDPAINERVIGLDRALRQAEPNGVVELVPTFRSLMIQYDPLILSRAELARLVERLDPSATAGPAAAGRHWQIPCCYEPPHGEDLAEAASQLGLSAEDLIALHSGATLRLYMYGFAPGFAYLGGVPPELHIPRRPQPRAPHPPGAIMIAGGMSLITTFPMPTGWWVIGCTPVPMFQPERDPPFLASVGDEIRFQPVDSATFDRLRARVEAGETIVTPTGLA